MSSKEFSLQEKIYNQNVEMGWWKNERSIGTFGMLIISEIAEAMEGYRKNLNDDHLPQYKMVHVELADTAIRVLDFCQGHGIYNVKVPTLEDVIFDYYEVTDVPENMFDICGDVFNGIYSTTDAYESQREKISTFSNILLHIFNLSYNIDKTYIYDIIIEKMEYNKHREDHKLENRSKEHGKKF